MQDLNFINFISTLQPDNIIFKIHFDPIKIIRNLKIGIAYYGNQQNWEYSLQNL